MEHSKKASKKSFSVPSAKGKADETEGFVTNDKASSKMKKETDTIKEKDKTLKDKKKGKLKSTPVKRMGDDTVTTTKKTSRPKTAPSKMMPRSLTDAEFEEIFQAVIDGCASSQDKQDDVYMAATQHDSQTKHESSTDKNIASVGHQKCGSVLEDDCELEGSDKENILRDEKAAGNPSDNKQLIKENGVEIKNKMRQDTDNGKTKKNKSKRECCTGKEVCQSIESKENETGMYVTEKQKKKKRSINKDTQDVRRGIIETDDSNKANDGKKKEQLSEKEMKNIVRNEHGRRKVKGNAKAVAKEKIQRKVQDVLLVSEGKVEDVSENENKKISNHKRQNESKKHKTTLKTGDKDRKIKTNDDRQESDDDRQESDVMANKHTEETDSEENSNSVSNCKESNSISATFEKQETHEGGPNTERKKESHKKIEKGKLSRKRKKDELTSGKTGKKSEESVKNGQSNLESIEKHEHVIKTKKAKTNSEPKTGMKDKLDQKKERQNEAEYTSDGPPTKDGEVVELSCEEKRKCKEEKDDVESILSEQSSCSSLLDMEEAVDQWDRLEGIQETNECTPCVSEAEATAAEINTKTVVHKPKKKKKRENQLAPRKLSFDAAASRKKQHLAQENDSDNASSVPAELGTWVQCEGKGCQKWRYLPDIHDPVELPQHWVCSMNKDERYNSCDKSEQDYDESDHIFTQYTLGSIVWGKMDGYPWWPAMVDTDPDCDRYCQIQHEDSMVPSDYHVVFLDEKVSRSWIRPSRIQHLLLDHLAPGSIFMKGHKFKKEIQAAMKRAEVALHMPLQDRLKHFGFSACFRNLTTRWTKADAKTKYAEKRKAPKLAGSVSSKKSKLMPDSQPSEYSSDSDLCIPNAGYSPSSDLSSSSDFDGDEDSDNDETTRKRFQARKKCKGERKFGNKRDVLKEQSAHRRIVKHKRSDMKGVDDLKPKKNSEHSMNRSHGVDAGRSMKSKVHRQEKQKCYTDSESSVGQKQFAKANPMKKKVKSAKKPESKSDREKIHTKDPLPALKSKDKNFENKTKKRNKDTCKRNLSGDKTFSGKECSNENLQKSHSKKTSKETKKCDSAGMMDQKPSCDQPPKKKKLFKSEMARKRDDALKLVQEEQQTNVTNVGDKKIKTRGQKFVAPVKPTFDKSSSKSAASAREGVHKENEIPDKSQPDQEVLVINKDDDTEVMTTLPKQDHLPGHKKCSGQRPPSPQPHTPNPAPRETDQVSLSPHQSPPLSPSNRDQFVPSMDDADKDSDEEELLITVDTDEKKGKSGEASPKPDVGKKRLTDGRDSDSDCLDLEEDLPIPSLQQVLQVPCKGSSDHDSESDPLEMPED